MARRAAPSSTRRAETKAARSYKHPRSSAAASCTLNRRGLWLDSGSALPPSSCLLISFVRPAGPREPHCRVSGHEQGYGPHVFRRNAHGCRARERRQLGVQMHHTCPPPELVSAKAAALEHFATPCRPLVLALPLLSAAAIRSAAADVRSVLSDARGRHAPWPRNDRLPRARCTRGAAHGGARRSVAMSSPCFSRDSRIAASSSMDRGTKATSCRLCHRRSWAALSRSWSALSSRSSSPTRRTRAFWASGARRPPAEAQASSSPAGLARRSNLFCALSRAPSPALCARSVDELVKRGELEFLKKGPIFWVSGRPPHTACNDTMIVYPCFSPHVRGLSAGGRGGQEALYRYRRRRCMDPQGSAGPPSEGNLCPVPGRSPQRPCST